MSFLWSFLEDNTNRYWFGSIVSLTCVVIAYGASKLIDDEPRLKTVLALFACGWVLQMAAYSAPRDAHDIANLASDLLSFVHIFAGVLLIEELRTTWTSRLITVLQGAAFWLLLALLIPRRQEFHAVLSQAPLTAHQADQVTSLILTLFAYLSLAAAAWVVTRGGILFWLLMLSLALYAALNSVRFVELWNADPQAIPRLGSAMVLGFAAAKLAVTAFFSAIVVTRAAKPMASAAS